MKIDLGSGELCLQRGEPIRLTRASGLRIRCLSGTVWITVAGDSADIFLEPGQVWQISGPGLALIESIDAGRVRLEMSRPVGKAGQWLARLAGGGRTYESDVRPDRFSRRGLVASATGFPA